MVLCGCLFALILFLGTRNIPKNFYRIRDDGLITLSHAKNLIDYGFIGVNPSGERVEGYSAPVQFILLRSPSFFHSCLGWYYSL
jgi:hypothetical protein